MVLTWLTAFLDFPAAQADQGIAFWQDVTGYRLSPRRGQRHEFATLLPDDGDDYLRVQAVGDPAPRVHLDLHGDLAARAASLGAVHVDVGGDVPTFRSPAGVLFCVVDDAGECAVPRPATWPGGRSRVDQVCLDIPPSAFGPEVAFWRELTGWTWSDTGSAEFERLDGAGALRILLQRLDDEQPEAAVHLDLSSDDTAAEVRRHLGLGARRRHDGRAWVTLEDPTGLAYCVTRRRPR